jgi:hypothetical protein
MDEIMFDFDGDRDIDEFDEELTEYQLKLIEDEIFLRIWNEVNSKELYLKKIEENLFEKINEFQSNLNKNLW